MYQVQGLVLEHNVLGKLFFRSDNTAEVSPGTIDVSGQQVTLDDVNPDDYESLQYFERVLRSSGIIDALQKSGITEGDTVSVYDVEFDYVP
jgi:GTP-binding protein